MIVFELQCDADHRFEGWFTNSEDFEHQMVSNQLACPVCGATRIRKVPTPTHLSSRDVSEPPSASSVEISAAETAVKKLVEYVRANYEDVGAKFPEEARRIHYGESDPRNIRGVATVKDVGELLEEGIAVAPVPAVDKEKLN
ncbi:MAG: hypothetical protein AMS22_17060 [Thiotrichales bacterium SG8_50]|jgi:hypothetical protein|nr:MAG: hypothetical protein AMS22_17060 [Thiotrichales bacterium SG8_50]